MKVRGLWSFVASIAALGLLLYSPGSVFATARVPIQPAVGTRPQAASATVQSTESALPDGTRLQAASATVQSAEGALPAALSATTFITLTAAGFTPATTTVTAGTVVVWYNAAGQSQLIHSGVPYQLYLPLMASGAASAASRSGPSVSRPTTLHAPASPGSAPDSFSGLLPAGGTFTHTFDLAGVYPYFLLTAPRTRGLLTAVPPDPAAVAPPVDPSVSTSLCTATRFIYSGTLPIQTGVAPGTIGCTHVAVLRGKVLARDGSPLSAVTVSILDHPEYGQTLSRADGMFDLAVNGGAQLTVAYARGDYLPVQRQVSTPWQDYQWLPDVTLTPVDPNVSAIDLSANIPIQVARGSVISDTSGQRRATLFFPQGVTATMVFSGGKSLPLTLLHVRATEYTVGAAGPSAMPGTLPPASGYMYAEEFSADEAMAAGAQTVVFGRPLVEYVEDYLGFPVGITVPVGTYDAQQAAWSDSGDGRVVKVLSTTGGIASLDLDGSGNPASPAALAAFGITDAERQELAALYVSGQSLMRIPIRHFSAYDT